MRIGGTETPIVFPTPRVRKVSYDLDAVLLVFLDRLAAAVDPDASLDDLNVLTLPLYVPSRYRIGEGVDDYEVQLVGLQRSGNSGEGDKQKVFWGFAPKTTDAPEGDDHDLYDIVVTTDVLAEGVNLQQAGHIINYDLPWNPMRLVQRHGRIDRIGSHHSEVVLRCVLPDSRPDDLLGLEERLRRKIAQAAVAVRAWGHCQGCAFGGKVSPGAASGAGGLGGALRAEPLASK